MQVAATMPLKYLPTQSTTVLELGGVTDEVLEGEPLLVPTEHVWWYRY